MIKEPTIRQSQCLKAIVDCKQESGQYPTIRSLGDRLGLSSTRSVIDLLVPLQDKGYLSRAPNRVRGIKLTEKANEYIRKHKWSKYKQLHFFDNLPRHIIVSGTSIDYDLEFNTFFTDKTADKLHLNTDAASMIACEGFILPQGCHPFSFDINSSSELEIKKRFNNLPQNISVTSAPKIIQDSITSYYSTRNQIIMSWHSSTKVFSYQSKNPKITLNEVNFSIQNTGQLILPFDGVVGLMPSITPVFDKFIRSLETVSRFNDFPISAAIMNLKEELFVCSSHVSRKKADFYDFILAVSGTSVPVLKGDRCLIRDLQSNFLSYCILKKTGKE